MVVYANEVEVKEKEKLPEIKNQLVNNHPCHLKSGAPPPPPL